MNFFFWMKLVDVDGHTRILCLMDYHLLCYEIDYNVTYSGHSQYLVLALDYNVAIVWQLDNIPMYKGKPQLWY